MGRVGNRRITTPAHDYREYTGLDRFSGLAHEAGGLMLNQQRHNVLRIRVAR